MAVGKYHHFAGLHEAMAKGEVDLATDTLVAILLSAAYTPDLTGDVNLADLVANEIGDAGYSRQTITGNAVTRVGGEIRINWNNIDFGDTVSLEGKYLVVFDDTHASDLLVALCDLNTDSTSATVSSTSGDFDIDNSVNNELTITPTAYVAGN